MKIMVFDVPAESGGALTILSQYYGDATKDDQNDWFFVISTPVLSDQPNIKVLKFAWVKKSWIHRLFFDWFIAHRLVEKHGIDEVLSLQNIIIHKVKVKQILYLHNALPFIEKRYKITENFIYWVYQNIISIMIFDSVRKADSIIVQTKWIMNSVIHKVGVKESKFILKNPKVNISVKKKYKMDENNMNSFFYPSSAFVHKNHKVLIMACESLKRRGVTDYKVILTVVGDENKAIKKIKMAAINQDLPIQFIGPLSINEVYDFYSKSTLLFPSYIETFGLPLLEARMHETPIIASDCDFSHEILDDYDDVSFFSPNDFNQLSNLMENKISRNHLSRIVS
jgi:glycosyltransferase involved in cell wall biosynthesis